jgi:glycosyltransferase involved in cell wall biosynthesis
MKLLFVNSFYDPHVGGGAELTLKRLSEGLATRGHRVSVLATAPQEQAPEWVNGVQVFRVPIDNRYWHFKNRPGSPVSRALWNLDDRYSTRTYQAARKLMSEFQPDAVSFHNLSGITIAAWAAAADTKTPSVQVLHDLYLACPATTMYKRGRACATQCLRCKVFRAGFAEQSRRLSHVVGVSDFVRDRLSRIGLFEGVPSSTINNAQLIPSAAAKALNDISPITFGFIGSLIPSKGIEWLISAFLATAGRNRLVIAGAGSSEYTEKLRRMAGEANITFLGHTDNADFYASIDVCIVPSLWPDTFPGVAIEASANSRPVIGSKIGGIPEIIQDGVNGLLCDPMEPSSLGEAMVRLDNDRALLRALSGRARSAVAPMLDFDSMVAKYEDLFHCVSGRAG